MSPTVTAILCTYNREEYLREALDSIFAQSYSDIEVIVVDDASTNEGMFEIIASYGDKIRLIRRSENSGTCELARYQGTAAATGELCAFLDSDDLWDPTKIEKQVAFMQSHPDIDLCHTYTQVIDENGKPLYVRHENAIPATGSCARHLLDHCFVSISSVMVRKTAWLDAQREEEITALGMEWDFLIELAKKKDMGFIPEVLASYRTSSSGITKQYWKWTPRDILSYERIYEKKLWDGIVDRREYVDIMCEAYQENADYHREHGSAAHAVWFCMQGLKRRPLCWGLHLRLLKSLLRGAGLKRVKESE